jgi:hypothetical protein
VVGVSLAVLLWKPWGAGLDDAGRVIKGATPAQPTAIDAQPTRTPPATQPLSPTPHPDAIACISGTGWRAVTRDVTAGRESRTWIAVTPAGGTGPQDQSIPSVRIVVGRLMAIGYCVPVALSAEPRTARLWRIDPDATGPDNDPSPAATTISPLRPLVPPAAGTARLFGPPAGEARWTAGRYVFALDLGPSRDLLWFSIQVVDSPPVPDTTPATPSPTPPVRSP